jgi:hypothetical protein
VQTGLTYQTDSLVNNDAVQFRLISSATCANPIQVVSNQINLLVSLPVSAEAGSDQILCGTQTTLTATAPVSGFGNWAPVSGNSNIANPNLASTSVSNLAIGNNAFVWTVSGTACPNSSDTVSISIIEGLQANAGPSLNTCTDSVRLNAFAVQQPFSGAWGLVSGLAQVQSPQLPGSLVSGLPAGKTILRWTLSGAGCPESSDTMTVFRTPEFPGLGPDTLLCDGEVLQFDLSNYASVLWQDGSTSSFYEIGNQGTYHVQLTTSTNCIFTDTIQVGIMICTRIASKEKEEQFSISPNPFSSQVFIKVESSAVDLLDYRLLSLTGAEILKGQVKTTAGIAEEKLDTGSLPSGMYIFEIETNGRFERLRLVKN